MTTSEKVAYLKGLAEGLGFDKESKEGRILDAILDILEDVAHDIEDLEENAWELGEAIDQVSDDLSDIEDIVYDLDEDEDDDEDEDECCGCCCEDEDEDEEPVFYEVTCPACENTITIDEDVLNLGSIECPNCGETLEFEGIEEDEDEDEGCCGSCCCDEDDEDDGEEPVFYEVTCPACENTITIDEDVLNLGSIECPNCGETLEFEGIEEDEDEPDDDGEDKD